MEGPDSVCGSSFRDNVVPLQVGGEKCQFYLKKKKKATSAISRPRFYGNGTSEEEKCCECSKITASSPEHVAFAGLTQPLPLRRWPGMAGSRRHGGVEVCREVGCCGLVPCPSSACPHLNPLAGELWSGLAAGTVTTISGTARRCTRQRGRGWRCWPGGEDLSGFHPSGLWVAGRVTFLADLPGDSQGEPALACLGDSSSRRGRARRAGYFQQGAEELGSSPRSRWWLSPLFPPDLCLCLSLGESGFSRSAGVRQESVSGGDNPTCHRASRQVRRRASPHKVRAVPTRLS